MSSSLRLKDSKGRVVLHMNRKGKIALSRYPDFSDEEVKELLDFYKGMDESADLDKIEKFLRFEDEEESFCS